MGKASSGATTSSKRSLISSNWRSGNMIDKIGDHEDWKDGHDAFRSKVWLKIKEIEERLENVEDGSNSKNRKET